MKWGYKEYDDNWKSPETVLHMLIDITGKGGNFILNVGPDAEGRIPQASADILERVGRWLKDNGESVYGTVAAPSFPYVLDWGRFTAKPGKLFIHIFEAPQHGHEIVVYGLKTKIARAYLLADPERRPVAFRQTYETARDEYRLRLPVPAKQDDLDTVVVLELEGEPKIYHW